VTAVSLTAALPRARFFGASLFQGFAPLAIDCRRSAAGIMAALPLQGKWSFKYMPPSLYAPRYDCPQALGTNELTQP